MQLKKALYIPALALVAAAIVAAPSAPAAAASANGHIVDLGVKVTTAAGGAVGTFHVGFRAQTVPVKPGGSYHLALIGWQVSNGKLVVVPVNATFEVVAGKANLTLSNAKDNAVDLKVGKTGGQLKYTTAAGYILSRNLKSGRITLRT